VAPPHRQAGMANHLPGAKVVCKGFRRWWQEQGLLEWAIERSQDL